MGIVSDCVPACCCGCRWARLDVGLEGGWSEEDLKAHKMVMNVGRRPTVNTGDEAPTVEAHIMHTFSKDFYGQVRRMCVGGEGEGERGGGLYKFNKCGLGT